MKDRGAYFNGRTTYTDFDSFEPFGTYTLEFLVRPNKAGPIFAFPAVVRQTTAGNIAKEFTSHISFMSNE
jgi:hypothetical protein